MTTSRRFILTAEVCDIRPRIWRTVDVSSDLTLGDLHVVLQLCFDWHDAHLHMFSDRPPYARGPVGKKWGPPSPWEADEDLQPERNAVLRDVFSGSEGPLFYEYDLGDSWLVAITAEASATETSELAVVMDGARRGPLEDSGGLPGYLDLIEVLSDPTHEDHAELRAWADDTAGTEFDPEAFDLEALSAKLARAQS